MASGLTDNQKLVILNWLATQVAGNQTSPAAEKKFLEEFDAVMDHKQSLQLQHQMVTQ